MSTTSPPQSELIWVDGPDGYALALDGTTMVCRNAKGRRLKTVPKKVRESAEAEQLTSVRLWLERHERECAERVESWLLGSLPVPAPMIARVWPDPAWRDLLADLFVAPADGGEGGFLRGVDDQGRIGVVDLDAESAWLDADRVALVHPVLIDDLDEVREFALELGITQRLPQLTREIHRKPAEVAAGSTAVTDYSGGEFEQLRQATGRAQRYGFSVRGGYAVCRVGEAGRSLQARYWIGSEMPDYETETGTLIWVDADERPLRLADVGPVAWSEGVRMAELIYAGRKNTQEETQR
ncbi:DUF4132 domain-containing protein [Actinorugispora endophytica]|uniref:Uncharacterized protein DUF4132 n=1 Tax=Actinorugispora endophytica TaxID=1605990 RepID=A0A4R6UQ22_9ACTN|nr:DUF4132 domain-containing protein [Actinorugispora endophytica]TDQ47593.1 uncharacterized protein DUF4132 [Actinorugispora endophytica]